MQPRCFFELYLSERRSVSTREYQAGVGAGRFPWRPGCPAPCGRCPQRVCFHFASGARRPPCRHRRSSPPKGRKTEWWCVRGVWCLIIYWSVHWMSPCLVDIMVVNNAVKALVDVIEHVHDFHGSAVLAHSGEPDYVTEIHRHFFIQLRLHHTSLLQTFHHWATRREKCWKTKIMDGMMQIPKLFVLLHSFPILKTPLI